tara:strand:- start:367 stop:1401 length:1035 start_codon:yes stop_codon:yes gene_type:complete
MKDKVVFIAGTRPELIKIAPVVNAVNASVIFTGQHFDKNMSDDFFNLLKYEEFISLDHNPKDTTSHLKETAHKIALGIDKLDFNKVIVQGDTNSTLAGSIAAKSRNKKLYFIESGMRSKDLSQIEEYNRVIVSHMSDVNFCNHGSNKVHLLNENIAEERIFLTGSTVFASVNGVELGDNPILKTDYILLTLHRPENVDKIDKLLALLEIIDKLNYPVIFPIHPRTKKMLNGKDSEYDNISLIDPQDYPDFIKLISNSKFLISDSGGVQEEAAILRKPLLIPRNYTERPEMLNIFNILTPTTETLKGEAVKLINGDSPLANTVQNSNLLYGEEEVIEKIVNAIYR